MMQKIDGRRRSSCGVCGKSTKLVDLKERIMKSAILEDKYAVECCPACFTKDVHMVQRKRSLKRETSQCNTCYEVFDADTVTALEDSMNDHYAKTDHRAFTIKGRQQDNTQ